MNQNTRERGKNVPVSFFNYVLLMFSLCHFVETIRDYFGGGGTQDGHLDFHTAPEL